jgi:glycine cleavage system aminomethyltransferase T
MLEDTILLLTPKCCYSDCKKILHEILGKNCFLDEFMRVYLIEGPGAASEVGALINEDVRSLQYYDSIQFSFDTHNKAENVCLRCSFFGEVGFLLFMVNEDVEAEKGCMNNLNFHSFDDDDIDTLVNEANSKVFNKSVFRHDCPIEIGLSHILDFEDDEFYFHLELNEAKKRNKRRIVAIQFKKDLSENSGNSGRVGSLSSVEDGSEVGVLLRTFYSKTINRVIGYALVDRDKSYLGSKLSHDLYETIEVHKAPFFVTKSNFLTA